MINIIVPDDKEVNDIVLDCRYGNDAQFSMLGEASLDNVWVIPKNTCILDGQEPTLENIRKNIESKNLPKLKEYLIKMHAVSQQFGVKEIIKKVEAIIKAIRTQNFKFINLPKNGVVSVATPILTNKGIVTPNVRIIEVGVSLAPVDDKDGKQFKSVTLEDTGEAPVNLARDLCDGVYVEGMGVDIALKLFPDLKQTSQIQEEQDCLRKIAFYMDKYKNELDWEIKDSINQLICKGKIYEALRNLLEAVQRQQVNQQEPTINM